jgi:hypothetical protein
MVLLVRHIPTWGGRCESIAAFRTFTVSKYVREYYERHADKSAGAAK